jgi:hypothetical protein
MGRITEQIQTYPLYRIEQQEKQPEYQVEQNG